MIDYEKLFILHKPYKLRQQIPKSKVPTKFQIHIFQKEKRKKEKKKKEKRKEKTQTDV
jgi:hypothetical protein